MTDKRIQSQGTLVFGGTVSFENNVGIGTATPSHTLSVGSDLGLITTNNAIALGSAGNNAFFMGNDTDNRGAIEWRSTEGALRLSTRSGATSYTDTMWLRDGNVGFGTDSPSTAISGDATVLQISDNNLSGLVLHNTSLDRKWTIFQGAGGLLDFRSEFGSATALSLATTGAVTLGPSSGGVNNTFNGGVVKTVTSDSSTGTANSFIATNRSIIRWTGGSALALNGFTGGVNGQVISFITASSQTVTVAHNSGSGTQKIFTTTASSMTFSGGEGFTAFYDSASSAWRMINSST